MKFGVVTDGGRGVGCDGDMRRGKAERVGVLLAAHAVCEARGEPVESVEVVRELAQAAVELAHVFGATELRRLLTAMVDEREAHHLAGALPHQHLHAVFCLCDVAFEPGAVFGVGLEAGRVERVQHQAHDVVEPSTHEFARPSDLVEREEDAQQDAEQMAHVGGVYGGFGRRKFWGAVSSNLRR